MTEESNIMPLMDLKEGKIDMVCNEAAAGRWQFFKCIINYENGGVFDK